MGQIMPQPERQDHLLAHGAHHRVHLPGVYPGVAQGAVSALHGDRLGVVPVQETGLGGVVDSDDGHVSVGMGHGAQNVIGTELQPRTVLVCC